ncbi:MAG TPA: class I SAM-dependent methyltransferase [Terriglobia bacterium]|nr:class I SAM-dependent methyltransferase [Terriglobia bacterium]
MESQDKYWNTVVYQKRFGHPLIMAEIQKHVGPRCRVLDYGCGYGRSLRELHEAGFANLYGIDYSAGMIARAARENPLARYARNSGSVIPFTDGSFDAVLLLAVLTCIPNSDEQARLFSELHRVLNEGGILYVSDLLINHDERNRERYKRFDPTHDCYGVFELEEGVTLRHHTVEHLERLAASFRTISRQEFLVETMNGHESRAIRMILQKQPHGLQSL